MDLTTYEWRQVVLNFEDISLYGRRAHLRRISEHEQDGVVIPLAPNRNVDQRTALSEALESDTPASSGLRRRTALQRRTDMAWKLAIVVSYVDLGLISELFELDEWYNSPLGWNKYHLMRAEGTRIRIVRRDRRALSHLIATISSLLLYLQFRDSSQGWLGLSIELYGLIIANYALVTGYAAEILIGKVSELVNAKSDRYGVIATRAIDRGYVRGFHVPNGDWLRYKNGHEDLPTHGVTKTEVNVTCNSTVQQTQAGMKIRTFGYNGDPGEELDWRGSEERPPTDVPSYIS